MSKIEVVIETYQSAPDMRITGNRIYTGKKAFFLLQGKSKRNMIYCTNTGNSVEFYIYIKGKRHLVMNDLNYACASVYRLDNLVGWFIQV